MKSKITGGATEYLFTASVLNKYPVKYYRCNETGFIQTDEPHWLNEAYSSAITSLDIGLIFRNIKLSDATEKIIGENLNPEKDFVDYAGGYGMFTRLMRDRGYNFFHTDKFCDNLFAKHFEAPDSISTPSFEMATAFELFEHLVNPVEEIAVIKSYSDTILFSTELIPDKPIHSANDWWYFVPETGQHVSFYTRKSLEKIGEKLGLQLHSNNVNLHMLTAKKIDPYIFDELAQPFEKIELRKWNEKDQSFFSKMKRWLKGKPHGKYIEERKSLLEKDFNYVKNLTSK